MLDRVTATYERSLLFSLYYKQLTSLGHYAKYNGVLVRKSEEKKTGMTLDAIN
jgi:hypothetical protein